MDPQRILEVLGEVLGSELGIGVVDLGLVYGVDPFAEMLRQRHGDCAKTARACPA